MTPDTYFPPPEAAGGWRAAFSPKQAIGSAGVDLERLEPVVRRERAMCGADSWSLVVIRRGYLACEAHTSSVMGATRFDVWSCTKSFTSAAWGMLFGDDPTFSPQTPAYGLIPEGQPLTDPRKERATVGHLLSMTSGIPGRKRGAVGMGTPAGHGPFEHALGRSPNVNGVWADTLSGEPGLVWDYSDPAFAHLAPAFRQAAGVELAAYLHERLFAPIGIAQLSWDVQGGGGFLGPHTNAHTGIHVSARELARFGYLYLRRGRWGERQVVPEAWVDFSTRPSQSLNPSYGHGWWTNAPGHLWPRAPRDLFAAIGFRSNRCYVAPSLDLVVVRIGSGPSTWDDRDLIDGIVDALV